MEDKASVLIELGLFKEGAFFVDEGRLVGVLAGEWGAFVGWIDVAWRDYAGPVTRLRDVVHVPFIDVERLAEALSTARARRSANLRTCSFCGEQLVPGHLHVMDSRNVCHGCAERHLGVVH
jgi:hypothetical protein